MLDQMGSSQVSFGSRLFSRMAIWTLWWFLLGGHVSLASYARASHLHLMLVPGPALLSDSSPQQWVCHVQEANDLTGS